MSTGLKTSQILLMASLCTALAFFCPEDPNAMSPEDPFVFYGDVLRLCCNVTEAERDVINPDDVMFTRGKVVVTGGNVSWESPEKKAVCLQHVLKDEGRGGVGKDTFYYCLLRPREKENTTHTQCLGYQSVQSDRSLLKEVQSVKLNCVTEGGKFWCEWQNITARFLYPKRVLHPRFFYGHTRPEKPCSVSCNDTTCRSHPLQQGADFMVNDQFLLHISVLWKYVVNDAYDSAVHSAQAYLNKTLSPRRRVTVPAPKELKVTSPDPRCVELTWLSEGSVRELTNYIYHLTMQTEEGSVHPEDEEFAENSKSDNHARRQVCGLSPFTSYTVSLKRRADYSDVWSDVSKTSVKTAMAPPDESPKLAPGCLLGSDQQLTLFWKAIPKSSFNAPDVQYLVNISRVGDSEERNHWSSTLIKTTQLSLPMNGSQLIVLHVQADNSAGLAANASRLALNLRKDGAKEVRAIIEDETEDEMMLNITWAPEPTRDYSYTVHWCLRRGLNSSVCRTELQWHTVSPQVTWFSRWVPTTWMRRLLYGVSLTQSTGEQVIASGFRFSSCLYHRNKDNTLQVLTTPECRQVSKKDTIDQPFPLVVLGILPVSLLFLFICGNFLRRKYQNTTSIFSPNFDRSPGTQLAETYQNLVPMAGDEESAEDAVLLENGELAHEALAQGAATLMEEREMPEEATQEEDQRLPPVDIPLSRATQNGNPPSTFDPTPVQQLRYSQFGSYCTSSTVLINSDTDVSHADPNPCTQTPSISCNTRRSTSSADLPEFSAAKTDSKLLPQDPPTNPEFVRCGLAGAVLSGTGSTENRCHGTSEAGTTEESLTASSIENYALVALQNADQTDAVSDNCSQSESESVDSLASSEAMAHLQDEALPAAALCYPTGPPPSTIKEAYVSLS